MLTVTHPGYGHSTVNNFPSTLPYIFTFSHALLWLYLDKNCVLKKSKTYVVAAQMMKKEHTYICSSLEYHSYTSWHPEAPMTCLLLAQYIHIIKRKLQGHSSLIMRVTWYYDENKKMSSARYRGATINKVRYYCYSLHHCVNLSFHIPCTYTYVIT